MKVVTFLFLFLTVVALATTAGHSNPKPRPTTRNPPATPKCTRPHEIFACGSACQTTCETLNQTCPIINVKCNNMCYCEEGYARDPTGNCVLQADCKDRLNGICGINEQYKRKTYFMDECSGQKLTKNEIPANRTCGCFCKTGYKRHASGLCVPKEQCNLPLACVRPNEEYTCGSACQTRCDNYNKPCPIMNIKCNDACYCKSGYARKTDDNSKCILIQSCPKKL